MTEDLDPASGSWVSPYTLPPLPSLQRARGQPTQIKSPEHPRPYYTAAWGSPYATPSPKRTPQRSSSADERAVFSGSSPSISTRQPPRSISFQHPIGRSSVVNIDSQPAEQTRRNPLSEHLNWLSGSEDSDSETGVKEGDRTPTRDAYLDGWGPSPISNPREHPRRSRRSESLATITPDIFHDLGVHQPEPNSPHQLVFPSLDFTMAGQEPTNVEPKEKTHPTLDRRLSLLDTNEKPLESPTSPLRPRPTSMQSYQRPKKKVIWKGKACIIALPLTDRETAGLPPLLTVEEVQTKIDGWVAKGYQVDGFELTDLATGTSVQSSGQSRPVFPDPKDIQSERKLRGYQVHIPNQAEWENWVSYLKEEKLRALGVSPSISEAPPSTRSPFSPPLSRMSSGYPGPAPSPPIAPSSSASNPLRANGNPFSPSLMSSSGISPQPGSMTSSQFNGLPKPLHGYKQSVAQQGTRPRINSPFGHTISQSSSFGPGMPPGLQPLSSRQNSFSPNHAVHLPNLDDVLSPGSQQSGFDLRGPHAPVPPPYARHGHFQSQANFSLPPNVHQKVPSPNVPQRADSLARTPEFRMPSRSPIEIAHPTPKSHRHNLSMALQREIDEAEAASEQKESARDNEIVTDGDRASRKDSNIDESVNDEPPILRRPETITDERSEIETNPSMAATPMLMEDDKNPFVNWQALSDAAKGETKPAKDSLPANSRLNVEAKEFEPRAGFSSSNFSFAGDAFAPSGPTSAPLSRAQAEPRDASKNRLSLSYLNADAPTFTPSFITQSTPKEPSFTFGSAQTAGKATPP